MSKIDKEPKEPVVFSALRLAELLAGERFSSLELEGRNSEVAARIIFRIYVASKQNNLLCKAHATTQAGVRDRRTADKYVRFLETSGLITSERSTRDRREVVLIPTPALIALVKAELAAAISFLRAS